MDTRIDLTLLDRYLANSCTPRERRVVEVWLSRHPSQSLTQLRASIQPPHADLVADDWETGEAIRRVCERLGIDSGVEATLHGAPVSSVAPAITPGKRKRLPGSQVWYAAFATISLAFAILWGVSTFEARTASPAPIHEIATGIGQVMSMRLPDGSELMLGPNSRVRYSASFGRSERQIDVVGHAFFTVTHAAGLPFVVRTSRVDTKVLGTSFSVRQYPNERDGSIIVADGKVSVVDRASNTGTIVTAGYSIRTGTHGILAAEPVENLETSLAWTKGILIYENTPVSTVVTDLQRLFPITIQVVHPTLSSQLVTGAFDRKMSPEGAAKLLALILGGELAQRGTTFYITERK